MKKEEKKKGGTLSWLLHRLRVLIFFRWLVFIIWNIPYLNSWRIKAGNLLGNTPVGDISQSLLSGFQTFLQTTMPQVFAFGAEHWTQIQTYALWFWNALLIQIPALLIVLFLLWQFGRRIRDVFSSAIAWSRRHGIDQSENLRMLRPRLAKEEHLILRAVIAGKESAYDLGAQRNIRLTSHISIGMIEGVPYILFSDGKKRLLNNSYRENDFFVELITVPI